MANGIVSNVVKAVRWRPLLLFALGLVVIVIAARYGLGGGAHPGFYTAKVERGSLAATVSTTGTLSAVVTVLVSTEVSGLVREILVDFNSQVKKGQVIARIDPQAFEARVSQVRAEVDGAEANVLNQRAQVQRARAEVASAEAQTLNQRSQVERATADVENARASLAVARAQTAKARVAELDSSRDLGRKVDLYRSEFISQSERDSAQAAYDSARAQLEAAEAQQRSSDSAVRSALAQLASTRAQVEASSSGVRAAEAQLQVAEAQLNAAEAAVRQRRGALQQAQVDLDRTQIRSPVDGIVVSRSVDVGQTVAASLQAPTLFTIAQDLSKMQVDTNVDEADIGRVQVGQPATFTVDAFRGESFRGTVREIRKAARVVQNVVTYNVVVDVENPRHRLIPGMTTVVRIVLDGRNDVLKVPNAALRFRPEAVEGVAVSPADTDKAPGAPGHPGTVWLLHEKAALKAVPLELGISDGSFTEVVGGELKAGDIVVVASARVSAPGPAAASASAPRLRY
jgi:HlyD family secretion protein